MILRSKAVLLALAAIVFSANGGVVINEIFYHAPDDIDDLEYVELHNPGDRPVDLTGWRFIKGIQYQFPPGTKIEAGGYLVVCRNLDRFKEFYGFAAQGNFDQPLSNSGERIELVNASGETVDRVKYKSRSPWPVAPDGYSSSLERISPAAASDLAANWASSPLSLDGSKPAGTPGKQNANFSADLPPLISNVKFSPTNPAPDQPVTVEAEVRDADGLREVNLRYRVAGRGFEKEETAVAMTKVSKHRYSATIPGQKEDSLIRFRVQAVNRKGSQRFQPGEHELRPAFSCFVHPKFEPGKIPWGLILNVGEEEFKLAEQRRKNSERGGSAGEIRFMARMTLESGLDLPSAWFELCIGQPLGFNELIKLRPIFEAKFSERDKLIEKALATPDLKPQMKEFPALAKSFLSGLKDALQPLLTGDQNKTFANWLQPQLSAGNGPQMQWGPERVLKRFINLEGAYFKLALRPDFTETQFNQLKPIYQAALRERGELVEAAKAVMQGKGDWEDLQAKVERLNADMAKQLKPLLAPDQEQALSRWRQENSSFMPGKGAPRPPLPPRGQSAFVYVDAQTREAELFDFLNVTERSAGYKVHFHKDHPLNGMTTINLIFETNDRFVLAEPLAYEVYQRAGNAAELHDFVRVWIDGQLLGYHLLIEQPNRSFLHRLHLTGDGNLYKCQWFGQGVVGTHEKKTNTRAGHDDLLALIDSLDQTKGDEQWAVIKKNFNVEQVINYFAVNTCLSHWDGFFNNYYAYHEIGGGKWEMYPWDQDKTWGFYDNMPKNEVFYDMPLSFGMEGDAPPGWPKDRPPPRGFGGKTEWWRPGGYFSKPLLANPQFRKQFLARTKELLENVYTEEIFFPIIDQMGERLKEEVRLHAVAIKEDPDKASQRFQRNLQSLRDHLTKRRKFLLEQGEIKSAGKFARSELN